MNLIILFDSDHLGDGRYFLNDYRAEHIIKILKYGQMHALRH